MKFSIQSVSYF